MTHEYLYTVDIRVVDKDTKQTTWERQEVTACNIHEAAGRLGKALADIRYVTKEIIERTYEI